MAGACEYIYYRVVPGVKLVHRASWEAVLAVKGAAAAPAAEGASV